MNKPKPSASHGAPTDRAAWLDRLATGAALLAVIGLIALAPIG